MLKPILTALLLSLPVAAQAQSAAEKIDLVLDRQILPGFAALADSSAALATAAAANCQPDNAALRQAYGRAFDDWVRVSHFRFGPTETDNRAFALAFWPDPRGKTAKALAQLLSAQDVSVLAPEGYAELSIAARGFYALELLLYEPRLPQLPDYACALLRASTGDIARISAAIAVDWTSYADMLRQPGAGSPYKSRDEVTQELFKALLTGLQFTADMRLGRPLGTFERPRPKRAEARRSARTHRHVALAIAELAELAALLAPDGAPLERDLATAFDEVAHNLASVTSEDFSAVADPMGWLQLDMVRLILTDRIREELMPPLGLELGVPAGFNALDGD